MFCHITGCMYAEEDLIKGQTENLVLILEDFMVYGSWGRCYPPPQEK